MDECKVCANADNEYCFACDNGNHFKPKTNADRIRSMTDEELASFFRDYVACDDCPVEPKKCGKGWRIPCKDVALSWLKEEVKEE